MKKKFFSKHIAGGLAVALVATSAISMLTPTAGSSNSVTSSYRNSGFNLVAKAADIANVTVYDEPFTLNSEHLKINGDTITGLNDDGVAYLSSIDSILEAKYGADYTSNKWNYKVILRFNNNLGATKIGSVAFKSNFNDNYGIKLEFRDEDGIKEIGESAFADCKAIDSITFGSKITTIGDSAFENCSNIDFVKFSPGLQSIGKSAFESCQIQGVKTNQNDLDEEGTLEIPDTVTSIGSRCFIYNGISKLKLSNELTTVPESAFEYNVKLKDIQFGNKLTTIGKSAFKESGISELNLPASLATIDEGAFEYSSNLTTINFATVNNLKLIGDSAFKNCNISGLLSLPEGLKELGNYSFQNNHITKFKLPNSIEKLQGYIFANNDIEKIEKSDFGTLEKLPVYTGVDTPWAGAKRWKNQPHLAARMIACGMFADNTKLTSVEFPDGTWAVGEEAFKNTDLRKLTLPSNIKNLFYNAFEGNRNLTEVKFELDSNGEGIHQIDGGSFKNCAIEGKITFPKNMGQMGGYSFANNKITGVDFGPDAPLIGYMAFENNPVETIENLNSWGLEPAPFRGSHALKNVKFEYVTPKPSNDRGTFGQSKDNTISPNAFKDGLLRSLNFPAYITATEYDMNHKLYPLTSAFVGNTGWADGTNKVALYRLNADKTTYETNNKLDDGKYHVFNPVAVKFELKDQYGSVLPVTNIEVQRTRTVSDGSVQVTTHSALVTDITNFKLGDRIKFTLPATPSGYELATNPVTQSWLNKVGNNEYEVTLDPSNTNIVSDVAYGDGYEVGYKQTVITINYRNTSNGGPVVPGPGPEPTPTPDTPTPTPTPTPDTTNPTDNTNSTPTDSNTNPVVDIDNQETPQGDTDIDDDTTPQGSTKIKKNVKADKTTEVKVEDTKTPQGSLPKTGGSNENVFVLLGGVLLGLSFVVRKKLK